jgi:hypothetical protein
VKALYERITRIQAFFRELLEEDGEFSNLPNTTTTTSELFVGGANNYQSFPNPGHGTDTPQSGSATKENTCDHFALFRLVDGPCLHFLRRGV